MSVKVLVPVVLCAVPFFVACEGGDAAGEGEGEGEGACAAVDVPTCDEPIVGDCRDDTFNTLSMNLTDAAPGSIENEDVGDGSFDVAVDATAGGFGGDGGWVYARFTDAGLEKVDLLDDESFDSTEWDIAFRRFIIRLNSGYAGPGCVSAANIGDNTAFEDIDCVPDGAIFNIEDSFLSDGESCTVVPDGSGLGSPGVVLQNWWTYPGCVATTGNVYAVSLADGRLLKLLVTQYYGGEGAQQVCNETGSAEGESARIRLRYAFLD